MFLLSWFFFLASPSFGTIVFQISWRLIKMIKPKASRQNFEETFWNGRKSNIPKNPGERKDHLVMVGPKWVSLKLGYPWTRLIYLIIIFSKSTELIWINHHFPICSLLKLLYHAIKPPWYRSVTQWGENGGLWPNRCCKATQPDSAWLSASQHLVIASVDCRLKLTHVKHQQHVLCINKSTHIDPCNYCADFFMCCVWILFKVHSMVNGVKKGGPPYTTSAGGFCLSVQPHDEDHWSMTFRVVMGKKWPHCDLTRIMVSKGNHPQKGLISGYTVTYFNLLRMLYRSSDHLIIRCFVLAWIRLLHLSRPMLVQVDCHWCHWCLQVSLGSGQVAWFALPYDTVDTVPFDGRLSAKKLWGPCDDHAALTSSTSSTQTFLC